MPPSQYTFPSFTLSDVITGPVISGDSDLNKQVMKAAKDPDDPPIVFAWEAAALETFITKMGAVPPGGPPSPAALLPLPIAAVEVGPA
eukprot:CAMPEP_0116568984 /NCGR_PEP_ID=MMETSP0397-20121206/16014_1 /TAXON_ID=216820 /ORGANISM="Cyclophora tenuis, Strain ECT3854" /LENGTH=87 /DNA_ID=CAMNT_0004096443 /DNA_START=185 /DNA_END=448 /DNA_ORIENTATION=-